jgi:dihydroorotate dehydrogenase (NAD+) catalytic subunit
VGLANPGLEKVKADYLPWLTSHLPHARKLINVVGKAADDFATVIMGIEEALGVGPVDHTGAIAGYELNVSCPNVKKGGMEFGADPEVLESVVRQARAVTRRLVFVKLSPTLPDVAGAARVCADSGADAVTLVNTLPGLVIDVAKRRPALGFGTGGVSGPGLLPVGVLATWKVAKAVTLPIIGVGGVTSAEDALQYIVAGATLVGVGTAALRDPRTPERIVQGLEKWCVSHGVKSLSTIRKTLEWPS